MATIEDYEGLVASQHNGLPKYMAMLGAILQPLLDNQAAVRKLREDFGLETAEGVQLDAVGKWIGRSRTLETPLSNVYFSFDLAGVGFDQGTWNGRYDPLTQLTDLPDANYRALLKIKARANAWDGSAEQLYAIFAEFIALYPGLVPFYQDRQDMSMLLGVVGPVGDAVLRELILGGYIPLKPSGVRVYYMVGTVDAPLFGFDMNTSSVAGFDTGAWGATS